jgi:hypothetical protein
MSKDNLSLKDDMVAVLRPGLCRLRGYVTEDIPLILWRSWQLMHERLCGNG